MTFEEERMMKINNKTLKYKIIIFSKEKKTKEKNRVVFIGTSGLKNI